MRKSTGVTDTWAATDNGVSFPKTVRTACSLNG
jgi:hypothetical protein